MNRVFFGFAISIVLLAACSKYETNPSNHLQASIIGKWGLDTLTTYFYDSAGLRGKDEYVYRGVTTDYNIRFQFNDDRNWVESSLIPPNFDSPLAQGTYLVASDSSFTLMYPNAAPGKGTEVCKILSLNNTSFIFSKQLTTLFNGRTPGYIKYVYKLSKE